MSAVIERQQHVTLPHQERLKKWQEGGVYQVYPLTFKDGNGDGIGDLSGLASKMGDIASRGVTALWLSPIYTSPMADGGYDVANYKQIDPKFGTIDDFDAMVAQAKKHGLDVIMEIVMNHTSQESEWFEESRSSKDNPKRDWYVWADGKAPGEAPNNWVSIFGGSAWEHDDITDQWYLHKFAKEQPDTNLRNPEVVGAMKDVMQFWIDHGVNAFRADALEHVNVSLQEDFSDMEPNPDFNPARDPSIDSLLWKKKYTSYEDGSIYPFVNDIANFLHDRGVVLIGECMQAKVPELIELIKNGVDLPFNFSLIESPGKISLFEQPELLKAKIEDYLSSLPEGATPNFVLGNHDVQRLATRIGSEAAASAIVMQYCLPGVQFIYNGDELGVPSTDIPAGKGRDPQAVLGKEFDRDRARHPYPWDGSETGGYSDASPESYWLPIGNNTEINAADEEKSPLSPLNLFRKVVQLRKEHTALSQGEYISYPLQSEGVFVFGMTDGTEHLLITRNSTDMPQTCTLPQGDHRVLLSTKGEEHIGSQTITLLPHETSIFNLQS